MPYLQPIQVVHIPKPRKDSNQALPSTVKRRSQIISKTRAIVSKNCPSTQLEEELQHISREQLLTTLERLNKSKVIIPKGHFLTAKAEICSSWKKVRELKR